MQHRSLEARGVLPTCQFGYTPLPREETPGRLVMRARSMMGRIPFEKSTIIHTNHSLPLIHLFQPDIPHIRTQSLYASSYLIHR